MLSGLKRWWWWWRMRSRLWHRLRLEQAKLDGVCMAMIFGSHGAYTLREFVRLQRNTVRLRRLYDGTRLRSTGDSDRG
jgi:hypothetical protein